MSYIIVGLGNPGEEYEQTRHNTGRMVVEAFRRANKFDTWQVDKKLKALVSKGKIASEAVTLLLPETFMNKSGLSVAPLVKNAKQAEKLVVVYDELDLPLGNMKVVFNRGSGGHKGIESIARSIKTKAFVRVRVGISPVTPSGKIKKPKGEDKVHDFILGKLKSTQLEMFKKISKKAVEVLKMIVLDGRERAMGEFNQK